MKTTPRSRWSGPSRPFHPFGRGLFMLLSILLLALPVPALAAPGDLDPSFDGDGLVLTDFAFRRRSGFEAVDALVVQPDGKLVAGGRRVIETNGVFRTIIALARYKPDGTLDRSFDDDGRVLMDFGGSVGGVNALVVQPDGKLVAGGGLSNPFLARFIPNGSLDTSFGAGGVAVIPEGFEAQGLVLQPDGKLVVTSFQSLFRFHGDGTLDTSFGGDGSVQGEVFSSTPALVLQPDGKLVTAGRTFGRNNGVLQRNFSLQRFNPDGSPDVSFGTSGLMLLDFGEEGGAHAVVLQPDGRLVVAGAIGRFDVNNSPDSVLARFHSDGSLDTTFGNDGVVVTDGGDGWDALVLQADGKLIAARERDLARYNPDGSPDTSFGSGGVTLALVRLRIEQIALQSDGKLVAGGNEFLSGDADFALARVLTTNERPKRPRKCGGRRATILGTSGNDTLRGTVFQDVILGRGGNDTIRGLQSNDTICGGPGRDTLIGGDGEDRLLGEDGDDKLFGDNGRDRLDGGSDRDACRTGERARACEGKPASSKPTSGERPKDPPRPPCPPISNFPCS